MTTDLEVWVMIDDNGDAVVSLDPDTLAEKYEEDVQACSDAGGLRRIKVTLTVALPTVLEAAVKAPDLEEAATAAAE
jgi:hypothetical protein